MCQGENRQWLGVRHKLREFSAVCPLPARSAAAPPGGIHRELPTPHRPARDRKRDARVGEPRDRAGAQPRRSARPGRGRRPGRKRRDAVAPARFSANQRSSAVFTCERTLSEAFTGGTSLTRAIYARFCPAKSSNLLLNRHPVAARAPSRLPSNIEFAARRRRAVRRYQRLFPPSRTSTRLVCRVRARGYPVHRLPVSIRAPAPRPIALTALDASTAVKTGRADVAEPSSLSSARTGRAPTTFAFGRVGDCATPMPAPAAVRTRKFSVSRATSRRECDRCHHVPHQPQRPGGAGDIGEGIRQLFHCIR